MKTFTIAAALVVGVALARPQGAPADTPGAVEQSKICLPVCWPNEELCPLEFVRTPVSEKRDLLVDLIIPRVRTLLTPTARSAAVMPTMKTTVMSTVVPWMMLTEKPWVVLWVVLWVVPTMVPTVVPTAMPVVMPMVMPAAAATKQATANFQMLFASRFPGRRFTLSEKRIQDRAVALVSLYKQHHDGPFNWTSTSARLAYQFKLRKARIIKSSLSSRVFNITA